jgi:hypothetical protein
MVRSSAALQHRLSLIQLKGRADPEGLASLTSLSLLVIVLVLLLIGDDCRNVPEHLGSMYDGQVGVLRFLHVSVLMLQELSYGVSSKKPTIISSPNSINEAPKTCIAYRSCRAH